MHVVHVALLSSRTEAPGTEGLSCWLGVKNRFCSGLQGGRNRDANPLPVRRPDCHHLSDAQRVVATSAVHSPCRCLFRGAWVSPALEGSPAGAAARRRRRLPRCRRPGLRAAGLGRWGAAWGALGLELQRRSRGLGAGAPPPLTWLAPGRDLAHLDAEKWHPGSGAPAALPVPAGGCRDALGRECLRGRTLRLLVAPPPRGPRLLVSTPGRGAPGTEAMKAEKTSIRRETAPRPTVREELRRWRLEKNPILPSQDLPAGAAKDQPGRCSRIRRPGGEKQPLGKLSPRDEPAERTRGSSGQKEPRLPRSAPRSDRSAPSRSSPAAAAEAGGRERTGCPEPEP
ncbi:uncharacterized protein LOC126070298 [Elephas maximus indicus]|uniref:uncharacterized protein LOC126070298 n=1 Tax=Elephas maximus indicus TaxID=99487 RepID=UPI002116B36C|nr:uncharacterized protein LOC126070298 [Elephas maximus indicus]